MKIEPTQTQMDICREHGSTCDLPPPDERVGIALQTLHLLPLNGLRHPPEKGTCGWYIWGGGELPSDPDFFQPLCVEHLEKYCPDIVPFIGLEPGWRVLVAPGQVDVWFDEKLKDI